MPTGRMLADGTPEEVPSGAGTLTLPPATSVPKVRLQLKTRVASRRCRVKQFAPQEFDGFIGASKKPLHPSHSLAGGRGVVWSEGAKDRRLEGHLRSTKVTKP